jgi:hypothetical protein
MLTLYFPKAVVSHSIVPPSEVVSYTKFSAYIGNFNICFVYKEYTFFAVPWKSGRTGLGIHNATKSSFALVESALEWYHAFTGSNKTFAVIQTNINVIMTLLGSGELLVKMVFGFWPFGDTRNSPASAVPIHLCCHNNGCDKLLK